MNITTSIVISGLALILSGATAWLSLLRRGKVRMTQPAVVYFGPDGGSDAGTPKIFLRTLLYATARRGRIIQSMYVTARRGETAQSFNVWVYGDKELVRGSGLFVGYEGVAANHHFMLPPDGTEFQFLPGRYRIDVYASLVGGKNEMLLWSIKLELSKEQSTALREGGQGVYFDWGPDSRHYNTHVKDNPRAELPTELLGLLQPHGIERDTSPVQTEETAEGPAAIEVDEQ